MRICWKSNKMVKIQWTSLRASENIKVDSHRGIPYCVPPVWVLLVLYYPSSSRSLISNRARWFNVNWWQNWQLNWSDGQIFLAMRAIAMVFSSKRCDTNVFGHMIPLQLLISYLIISDGRRPYVQRCDVCNVSHKSIGNSSNICHWIQH